MLIKIRLESRFETRNWAASFSRLGVRVDGSGEGEKAASMPGRGQSGHISRVSRVYPFVFSPAATVESSLL